MIMLTHEALENQKAKVLKLRGLDNAIARTFQLEDQAKAALQRAHLELQKLEIRATFPKPTLVKYD